MTTANPFSKPVESARVDAAVAAARMRGAGKFTLADVLSGIPGRKTRAITEQVERALEMESDLFHDGEGNYAGRDEFFAGAEFVITPDDWEIDEGVLFPGHRFSAFVAAEVFPSEVDFRETGSAESTAMREVRGPLVQFFPYHLLMGSEQVFDFLIAEHPDNGVLTSGKGRAGATVTLGVFDLRDFYRRTDFSGGDALLCRVTDWRAGRVEYSFLPGGRRPAAAVRAWCDRFSDALERVIDRFDNYLDIPEQLARGCFDGGDAIVHAGAGAASLDEFIRGSSRIEVGFDAGHTVLTRRAAPDADAADDEIGVPDGVGVSRGATDSLGALLTDSAIPVTPVEIDSFILDCCYLRELDFESFFARCFGRDKLEFADDAQEAVFYNYVEDRWEELTGNYNRVDDELKAPLRSTVLEIVDARLEYLNSLRAIRSGAAENPPEADMRKLAEVSLYLDELLRLLNSPEHTLAEGEAEAMAETIAGVGDTVDDLIARLEEKER